MKKKIRIGMMIFCLIMLLGQEALAANILYYGHRGYTGKYPENTLAGFKAAAKAGCDGIEFDVFQTTKGGSLMVFHDSTLSRVCKIDRSIYGVDENNRGNYLIKDGNNLTKLTKKQRLIPTLEETIELASKQGLRMFIHLKQPGKYNDAGLNKIVSLLEKYKMTKNSVVFCSSNSVLKKLKKMGVEVGYLDVKSTTTDGFLKNLESCKKNNITNFVVFWPYDLNKTLVKTAKKYGISIGCYKVQSQSEANKLKKLGVNFMFNYNFLYK